MGLVNIGYGNIISEKRLIAIVSPDSAPVKRLISQTKESSKLIDGTCGRRTKSVLILDSGHIVLSAILPETIAQRLESNSNKQEEE